MKLLPILLLALLLCFEPSAFAAKGKLLLIGGGARPVSILQTIVKLSNLKHGRILILPLASEIPDEVAASAKAELLQNGAKLVSVFACKAAYVDAPQCLDQIRNTDLIYFTGGDQNRLMHALARTLAFNLISIRHYTDALPLVGTSAGTAVMSEVMITGNPIPPNKDFGSVRPNLVEVGRGFGFVKKLLIDQHFIKRQRQNRLMSAVLDRPHLVGVGIDESTAILVNTDESFQVIGASTVMVIDARKAKISVDANGNYVTQNLKIGVIGGSK